MALSLVGACGGGPAVNARTRAAYDLQCPAAELEVTYLGNKTAGVRGCGQQVTYVLSCGSDLFDDCVWVLNSDSRRVREQSAQ
jgi:hypothetical protein